MIVVRGNRRRVTYVLVTSIHELDCMKIENAPLYCNSDLSHNSGFSGSTMKYTAVLFALLAVVAEAYVPRTCS
jgi:hypothetical protein